MSIRRLGIYACGHAYIQGDQRLAAEQAREAQIPLQPCCKWAEPEKQELNF